MTDTPVVSRAGTTCIDVSKTSFADRDIAARVEPAATASLDPAHFGRSYGAELDQRPNAPVSNPTTNTGISMEFRTQSHVSEIRSPVSSTTKSSISTGVAPSVFQNT